MKAYICYYTTMSNNLTCFLILEDKIVIASHICSNEDFMAEDLWYRQSRKYLRDKATKKYGEIELILPPLNESDTLFHFLIKNSIFNYITEEDE